MPISDLRLSGSQIARLLGVDKTTVERWVKRGVLSRTRGVSGAEFAEFLYFNPKYRNIYEKSADKNCEILSYLNAKPYRMYTYLELSDIFQIRESAIQYWEGSGKLKAIESEKSLAKKIFRSDEIERFILSSPILKERYGGYLPRLKRSNYEPERR